MTLPPTPLSSLFLKSVKISCICYSKMTCKYIRKRWFTFHSYKMLIQQLKMPILIGITFQFLERKLIEIKWKRLLIFFSCHLHITNARNFNIIFKLVKIYLGWLKARVQYSNIFAFFFALWVASLNILLMIRFHLVCHFIINFLFEFLKIIYNELILDLKNSLLML